MSTAKLRQTTLPVTSKYGPRKLSGRDNFHKGTDFPFGKKTPISAFGAGRVKFAGRRPKGHPDYERGIHAIIEHAPGIDTSYHSLNALEVSTGDTVAMGETIGYGGRTAVGATGDHCHVGLWLNGQHVNLENYLTPGKIVTISNDGRVSSGDVTPFPNTPTTPGKDPEPVIRLDDRMIRIQSPGRGIALIGAGYYRQLANNEEVNESGALMEKHMSGNDRQFDLWVAMATTGKGATGTTDAISAATKVVRDDIGYIHDKSPNSLKNINAAVAKGTNAIIDTAAIGAQVAAAVSATIEKQGVKIDSSGIAAAVDAVLADNFAAIPDAVADEHRNRLES